MKSKPPRSGPFGTVSTHWTELRLAAQFQRDDILGAREAFHNFCQRYWTVVYEVIRSKRPDAAAQDLTQQFFLKYLIERDSLSKLDPARGSFRGWLWTVLRNFLIDDFRNRTRQESDERARSSLEAVAQLPAADMVRGDYEFYYARNVAQRSIVALQARWAPKLARRGVTLEPDRMLWWLIERDAASIAASLNIQPDNARQLLRRLHVDLWRLLATEVGQTVADCTHAHDELRHICCVLGIEPPSLDARAH